MKHSRRIYWVTPTSILGAFALAVALAVGHHCFYAHLSSQLAPSGDYSLVGTSISKQQYNFAAGTAFALLFKSILAFAVATSYTQLFWHVMRVSKQGNRVADVDAAYSLSRDLLGFFRTSTWRRRYVVLVPVAIIFWLLPVASIFTPATLSVHSQRLRPDPSSIMNVPHFDFLNSNFFGLSWFLPSEGVTSESIIREPETWHFEGPSKITQNIADTAAVGGQILRIEPPLLNSTWSYEFFAPAMHCHDVSEENRTRIARNYVNNGIESNYYAWRETQPYVGGPYSQDTSLAIRLPTTSLNDVNGSRVSLFMVVAPSRFGRMDILNHWYANVTLSKIRMIEHFAANMTIIGCELYNASYHLEFRYHDGVQSLTPVRPRVLAKAPINRYTEFSFPRRNQTWGGQNEACVETGRNLRQNCTFVEYEAKRASYMAIEDAFHSLVTGELFLSSEEAHNAAILRTPLMETDELAIFVDNMDRASSLQDAAAFVGRKQPAPQARGSLKEAAEQLFENITISLLSAPMLQPNVSSPNYSPLQVEVASETWANVYAYDYKTLWIAYGVALTCAALALLVGSIAVWQNGVAYDTAFSTVLRATYISNTTDEANTSDASPPSADDGSTPLPKSLASAIVIVNASFRGRHEKEAEPIGDSSVATEAPAKPEDSEEESYGSSLLTTVRRRNS